MGLIVSGARSPSGHVTQRTKVRVQVEEAEAGTDGAEVTGLETPPADWDFPGALRPVPTKQVGSSQAWSHLPLLALVPSLGLPSSLCFRDLTKRDRITSLNCASASFRTFGQQRKGPPPTPVHPF